MDNLSALVPGGNPGPGSVVSRPTGPVKPLIPIEPVEAGPADWIPQRLRDQKPLPVVYFVFPYIDTFARRTEQACVWESYRSISRRIGIDPHAEPKILPDGTLEYKYLVCEGSVRRALDWLDAMGWTYREERDLDGEMRTFIWCRWLIDQTALPAPAPAPVPAPPPTPVAAVPVVTLPAPAPTASAKIKGLTSDDRYDFLIGGSFVNLDEVERRDHRTPRARPGATRADSGATRARSGAACAGSGAVLLRFPAPDPAQPAPDHAHRLTNGNGSGTGPDSGPGEAGERPAIGDGPIASAPERMATCARVDPAEPPPLPDLKPEDVAQMIATLRTPVGRPLGLTIHRATWASLFYRGLLPEDLEQSLPGTLLTDQYPEMPSRESLSPQPSGPKRPIPTPAAVPVVIAKPLTMMGRLRGLADKGRTAEDLEAEVVALACDLADEWKQAGWMMGFAERLRRVVRGERSGERAAEAYGRASSQTAENPGSVFMAWLGDRK